MFARMSEATKERILARLTGDDDGARRALVRAAIDHAMGTPLETCVDRDAIVAVIKAAIVDENVLWASRDHLRPAIERQRLRSHSLGETVGDLLPADADELLGRILDGARMPEPRWVETLVDRKLVNKLVAPIVQETLLSFAKRLPLPGIGGGETAAKAGALFGGLAGSAGKLFDVGKSLVGGLSAEVEKKMREVAKDFADNVGENLRGTVRARLTSEEGKRLIREIALSSLARSREVPVAEILEEVEALPAAEVDAFVAAIASHNGARAALADALCAEADALLAIEGEKPLGELLEQGRVRAEVEAAITGRADAVLRGFFSSEGFADVVDLILDER
jgi:hypothetical protein